MSLVVGAEEAEVVQVSGVALFQLSSRLNGTDFPSRHTPSLTTARALDDEDPSFVSVDDGAGFVDLLREVVNHYAPSGIQNNGDCFVLSDRMTEQQRVMALRHIIFEIHPELISTIISILHAPHMMAEDDDVCRLFRGALLFLQSVLLSCCVPWDHCMPNSSNDMNNSEPCLIESAELSAVMGDLLERLGAVVILSDLLYDEFPFSVRQLAAQVLFIMLLRGSSTVKPTPNTYVRNALSSPDRLAILISVVASPLTVSDSQEQKHHRSREMPRQFSMSRTDTLSHAAADSGLLSLRLHAAACLRELANTHFVPLANITVLDMLQQLMMNEQNSDLRALAIETFNLIVQQNDASIWVSVPFKKELVAWCATQLEGERSNDALRTTLSLIETLILKDTSANNEGDSIIIPGSYVPMVCEVLLALFADRALALLIGEAAIGQSSGTGWDRVPFFRAQYEQLPQRSTQGENKQFQGPGQKHFMSTTCMVSQTAVLAARSLRLLIQHAPHYRNGSLYLVQHFSSSARLLEVTMRLAEQHEARRANCKINIANGMDELKLVLSVELALIIALSLAQDPLARQLLVSEFTEYPSEARHVRRALISNLNLVSLSYFGSGLRDFCIMDVTGTSLNVLDSVSWDTPDRPSRASVHDLFTSQEARLNTCDKTHNISCSHNDGRENGYVHNVHKLHEGYMDMSSVPSETRHQRLTFIILSYAIHYTFKFASDETVSSKGADITVSDVIPGRMSKANQKKKMNRHAVPDQPRYYGSFLVDARNGSNQMRSPSLKQYQQEQEQQQQQREPLLSPVPRDPRHPRERLMSPSRPPWLNFTDASFIAPEEKNPHAQHQQQQQQEEEVHHHHGPMITKEDNGLFQQYQRGLQLFTDLAKFYSRQPTSVALAKRTVVYEETSGGLFRRQGKRETQKTMSQILGEESNLKGKKTNENASASRVSVRRDSIGAIGSSTRSWSIEELQEGDLFYFSIPYMQLSLVALRHVRRRAEHHAHRMKKLLAVTPQSAKARRWLLHDAVVNILPGIIHNLSQFIQWFDTYDEETVKLPLLIFFQGDERERQERKRQDEQEQQQQWDQARPEDHLYDLQAPNIVIETEKTSLPQPDEVALHAGNLIPLARQVAFYLQRHNGQSAQKDPYTQPVQPQQIDDSLHKMTDASGLLQRPGSGPHGDSALSPWHSEGPLRQRKSALLNDINREMSRLQAMEFGDERSAELLLPDIAVSPYGETKLQQVYLNKDFDDASISELSEGEDDFDELSGF